MPVTIDGTTGIVTPNITGNGSVPVGSVYHFASSTAPVGFLVCNGDVIPNGSGTIQGITANFSNLYAIVGSTYGVAGSLPDLRGYFVRGSGTNSDGTAASTLGTKVADTLQNITGKLGVVGNQPAAGFGGSSAGALFSSDFTNAGGSGGGGTAGNAGYINFNAALVARTSTETKPRNMALLPCIKY